MTLLIWHSSSPEHGRSQTFSRGGQKHTMLAGQGGKCPLLPSPADTRAPEGLGVFWRPSAKPGFLFELSQVRVS